MHGTENRAVECIPGGKVREIYEAVGAIHMWVASTKGHIASWNNKYEGWAVWVIGHEPNMDWDLISGALVGYGNCTAEGNETLYGAFCGSEVVNYGAERWNID